MTKHKIRKMVNEYLRKENFPAHIKARFQNNLLIIDNIQVHSLGTAYDVVKKVTGIETERIGFDMVKFKTFNDT